MTDSMKIEFIEPSIDVWGPPPLQREGMLRRIELAGRVCYKSEDKITPESSLPFVLDKAKKRHMSVLEFGWCVFRSYCDISVYSKLLAMLAHHRRVQFHKLEYNDQDGVLFIGGSLRAWIETLSKDIPWHLIPALRDIFCLLNEQLPEFFPMEGLIRPQGGWAMIHSERKLPPDFLPVCVKFIINRGITHEMVRHRPCSFLQESTRYVNYKDRPARFILPKWFYGKIPPGEYSPVEISGIDNTAARLWASSVFRSYQDYRYLMNENVVGESGKQRPEQARGVLPNDLAAELLVQADPKFQWSHMFHLRSEENRGAHPQMRESMEAFKQVAIDQGWYTEPVKRS